MPELCLHNVVREDDRVYCYGNLLYLKVHVYFATDFLMFDIKVCRLFSPNMLAYGVLTLHTKNVARDANCPGLMRRPQPRLYRVKNRLK